MGKIEPGGVYQGIGKEVWKMKVILRTDIGMY